MKKVLKMIILFLVFGALYFCIETVYKGHITHWTMFVLAGFLGVLIGGLNEHFPWEMSFWQQCFCGMMMVTLAEGLSGLVLNVWLGLHIWDYSHTPCRFFFDQCSVPFSVAWFFLSGVCIIIDDIIRWSLFGEEKPHYNWGCK